MKSFIYAGLFMGLFLLGSCAQNEDELNSLSKTSVITSIQSGRTKIDRNDAIGVAKSFFAKNKKSRGLLSDKSIASVEEIIGTKGDVTMYAVNFERGGFALVGTTKNFYPILAYSENGYFDSQNLSEEIKLTIGEYGEYIDNNPDEARKYFADAWMEFEKTPMLANVNSLGIDNADFQFKIQEMSRWRDDVETNYQCYDLRDAYEHVLSGDLKNTAERYLSSPDADMMFILLKTTSTEYNVGPLIKTYWNQSYPYNKLCSSPLVGCVALAVGQIMKFHQWPASYNWSAMQNTYSGWATTEPGLLHLV